MGDTISLCYPASAGVNVAEQPIALSPNNAGRFIQLAGNMRICDGWWRTDYAWKELQPEGDAAEQWQKDNTQGAIWYKPRAGEGSHYLGAGNNRIVESAAGRLYTLEPKQDTFLVTDISGGIQANPGLMLSWLCQAENYVIRTDGKSLTQIWDGKNPVFTSPGYNSSVKSQARFPNAAGPTVYAGGRLWTVLFGRRIYASDALHQVNQYSAEDLLKFEDQSYDFLNVYFAPPADEGDIVSLLVSMNSGFQDSRAQGEVLAACRGPALWGVALGVDRLAWPTTKMRQSRSTETAPTGPFAFTVRDGDIVMRTNAGIESVNLLARERNSIGNPVIDLGADLRRLLERDDDESLLFASMANPRNQSRMFCTLSPVIRGAKRYHMGYFSSAWNPTAQREPKGFAWEGIHTLPYKMGRVIQFLESVNDGKPIMMALLDKEDGTGKGLAEFTQEEGPNVFADGTTERQNFFLLTKRLTPGGLLSSSEVGSLYLVLEEMRSDVDVDVYVRCDLHKEFKLKRKVRVKVKSPDGSLCGGMNGDKPICIGKPFSEWPKVRWMQVLIVGKGIATVDIHIQATPTNNPEDKISDQCLEISSMPVCSFDPFYATLKDSILCQE